MFIHLFIFLIIAQNSFSTTSIKTYPTVNLTENLPINTNVIKLITDEQRLKLILLNLGGFETNLFEIKNESLYTINEIDREQFVGEKRCFDRLYCLIELHILVNDGQQYWVIPIHIIDENDNKPQFKSSAIELKYSENNFDGYKIPFEGAIDSDEGINNKIYYVLDCSIIKKDENFILNFNLNERLINCFPLFDLIIFSQSLINQNDQLGLKFNPSFSLINEYQLILYGFNFIKRKELINSMIINIKIDKILNKPKFLLSEYKFLIKEKFLLKPGKTFIGKINAKSNDLTKNLIYKIENETNDFEINSLSGELFLLKSNLTSPEINLLVSASYLINENVKSLINVKILIRLLTKLTNNILINSKLNELIIKQLNSSNQFLIKQNLFSNEILFNFSIFSSSYPSDQFVLSLFNFSSIFSLIPFQGNNYSLIINNNFPLNSFYLLIIQIKHQLTTEYLSNLTIKLIVEDSSSLICLQNSTFNLYNLNKTNFIGKLKVIETNSNISKFTFSKINSNELILDQCRMFIDQFHLNQSEYQLCSLANQCWHISHLQTFILKRILTIRPIEITILTFSFVFILATITLILIICRLKGFHLCLTIKNYLFYGKKYGLNNAQRISTAKITQRVHSIVVRESQSPSIEHIKSKPFLFNINQFIEQDKIPSIHLYPESSSDILTSSLQRRQRTISNIENQINSQTSSAILQENNQFLDMISSNQDLSRLASEV